MSSAPPSADLPAILLQADNLPSLPAVAVEVLNLTRDDEATIDDLANAISRDPALAAKLLKLSNSSLFSQGQTITTLQRAVMQLGLKTVKLMSLSFSLVHSLPRSQEGGGFDYDEYWHRSLVSAVAARNLAGRLQGQGDEAFLCGLLRHIGRMVIARCMSDSYGPLLAARPWPSLEEEHIGLGFTSADVAYSLLKSWELPDVICQAIGFAGRASHLPADTDPGARYLIDLLEVVEGVENFLRGQEALAALEQLGAATSGRFGWDEEKLEAFLMELEPELRETASMLSVELPSGKSHAELIEEARTQIIQVSLAATADLNQVQRQSRQLADKNRELEAKAHTDGLTGLPNRSAFDAFLKDHVGARVRGEESRSLGLIMLDVDHFKRFNDTFGHQVGDEVLRMVGAVLLRMTRKGDLAARYGGEEFAVVAPTATAFGLKSVAERLRKAIEAEVLHVDGQELSVTASFGCACIKSFRSPRDEAALIRITDQMLYRAKEKGRNRTEVYSGQEFPGS